MIGVSEMKRKLSIIIEETDPKLTAQALRAAMKPMLSAARANAPSGKDAHRTYKGRLVSPGFLKRNIKLKKLKSRDKSRAGYGLWAQGEAFYGGIIESGAKHIRTNPWLGKAYKEHKDGVERSFKDELSKRIMRKAKQIRSRNT